MFTFTESRIRPVTVPYSFVVLNSFNKILVLQVILWVVWISFHTGFLMNQGWERKVAIADSLISNIFLAAICTGLQFSIRYNRPDEKRLLIFFFGILISAGLLAWLTIQLIPEFVDGGVRYQEFVRNSFAIRFLTGFFIMLLFAMAGWITFFFSEQREEKNRNLEINRLAREAELLHLRQQLQPHFLFNTLNSVSALTIANPEAARKMIHQLSDFLRGTLKMEDHKTVKLQEELTYLNLYLEIEKVRFGDRLQTEISSDPDAYTKLIPLFLLQPLVENAIKFGLYDTIDQVKIRIDATTSDNFLNISITNPFDLETSQAVPGTGYGLNAVKRRLFLLFNRNDLLEVNKSGSVFTVILKIPQ